MSLSKQITAHFLLGVDAGHVTPTDMVSAIHGMHAALLDKYPGVALWMMPELEQVGDRLTVAIESAEICEQDYS